MSLPENLRFLCQTRSSVSQICRELGVNRHQFERYLTGKSRPSRHNLLKICQYFGVSESDLELSNAAFQNVSGTLKAARDEASLFAGIFPGEIETARRFVGIYHAHFVNMSWPDKVQRAVCVVQEQDGEILTRYMGRVRDPHSSQRLRSSFRGKLSVQADRVIILERSDQSGDSLAQTILMPPERHNGTYITGLSFMLAWRPHRAPFCSRIIWKRLPNAANLLDALRRCGLYDFQSTSLDPVVRSFFAEKQSDFITV